MNTRWILILLLLSGMSVSVSRAESEDGAAEYRRYCSACHGESADGKGPAANALDPGPPALTGLRAKYGNPLSTELVVSVMGTTMPRAHGTSNMPVWGRNLADPDGDDTRAIETIWRIVHYLDSIQSP
ncbi:MAG: hypothetical protein DRQ60_04985 [Gammaproteobacteria bacterium]|nr:MAG: hypothetical protein DRQ60_04985 [Gammaproteobacteria bacterium]